MILFAIGMIWALFADRPSQLLLLAIAILLRILYVTGRRPMITRGLIGYWVVIFSLAYFLSRPEWRDAVVNTFCVLTLLGTLSLHLMQQLAESSLVRRIPAVQHVGLFSGRYLVLSKREVVDMKFWASQNIRAVRHKHTSRNLAIRKFHIAIAFVASRAKIAFSLFHNARSLIDRWDAIVSARGKLPRYDQYVSSLGTGQRTWYADLLADAALSLILLLPMAMANETLVPGPILAVVRNVSL
ncbi:MAG TPA: hypothetical protein VGW40_13595 [Allosphingosinicella sp.]|nr:hypothetical protein [Allosphingosinicella sp.]